MLNLAVIGTGYLGTFHALKLAQNPEVNLKYLVDKEISKAQKVKKNLERDFSVSPEIFENYEEILKKNDIDGVIIATPTSTHYQIALSFLKKNIPVFLEKPIAHKPELVIDLVETSEKLGVPLQVGFIERFQKPVKELLKRVEKPLFIEGKRLSPFVERNLDIDVILDLMIHDLDLLMLLKGGEKIRLIHAVGAPVFTSKIDVVNVRIVFEDETTCNLTASRISLKKERKFSAIQKGKLFLVDTCQNIFKEVEVDTTSRDYKIEEIRFEKTDPLKEEIFSFVESLKNGKKVCVPAKECVKAHEIAFKIKELVEKFYQNL